MTVKTIDLYNKKTMIMVDDLPSQQLLMQLFSASIARVECAKNAILDKRFEDRTNLLDQATDLVSALSDVILDSADDEEYSHLSRSHSYILKCIRHSYTDNNREPLEIVSSLLTEMRESWLISSKKIYH